MKAGCLMLQVFEYLTTDLKKYMDSTGKGPKSTQMPRQLIKVVPLGPSASGSLVA